MKKTTPASALQACPKLFGFVGATCLVQNHQYAAPVAVAAVAAGDDAAAAVDYVGDNSAAAAAAAAVGGGEKAVSHEQLAARDGALGPDHTGTAPLVAPQNHGHSPHQPEQLLAAAGTVPGLGGVSGDTWKCAGHSLIEESCNAAVGVKSLGHAGMRKLEHACVAEHD